MNKRRLFSVCAVLGAFSLAVCLALTGFLNTATDGELYYKTQIACQVEPGVSREEMHRLDLMLADCLSGDAQALSETEAFNSREKAHMADVAGLFDLARLVKLVSAFLAAAFLLIGLLPAGNRKKRVRRALGAGSALFFLPLIAGAAWALIDFDSAFYAMHRLLFNNELWLMDPATDLMIRMLPEEFFISFARTLAIRTAFWALAMPAALGALSLTGILPDGSAQKEDGIRR